MEIVLDRLRDWRASSSAHLLLDLRSSESFLAARLSVASLMAWPTLEANWFALPPQHSVPFAVLLPDDEEGRRMDQQRLEQIIHRGDTPDAVEIATAAAAAATVAASTVSAPAASGSRVPPPPGPSSPHFEYSHAALLDLLRFYGWVIPAEWVFVASPQLWSAARELGLLRGAADPVERRVLFSPSPYLERHFDLIQTQLTLARQASEASPKQPRSETAVCVASAAEHPDSTPAAATAASSEPFECLDVACGSGRDMCWLLSTTSHSAAQSGASSPARWRVTGVDVSPSSLERAHHLARQLEVDAGLTTCAARIHQGNGSWRSTAEKPPSSTPPATTAPTLSPPPPSDTSSSAAPSSSPAPAAPSIVAASGAPTSSATTVASSPAGGSKQPKGSDQRREKRKLKDALRAAAAAAASPSPSSSAAAGLPFLSRQYDLILMVRFLSRVFLRSQLSGLLKPGGYFLLSTFIEDGVTAFDHPGPEFRIAGVAEIDQLARHAGLEVVFNAVGRCEDGRPLSDTLLRKPLVQAQLAPPPPICAAE